ncbi:hypothetical protein XPA_007304 [Xanthoria parietina]
MTAEQLDEVIQKRQLILAERRKQNRMFKQKLDVRLFAEALCSFGTTATIAAETSSRQTLDRCTVPVTVCQPVALWDRMAQVYQTVMLAIARSGVTVNNLQIYSGTVSSAAVYQRWLYPSTCKRWRPQNFPKQPGCQ